MKKSLVLFMVLLCTPFFTLNAATGEGDDTRKADGNAKVENAPAESWEFYSTLKEPTAEEVAMANNHRLGKEVACLYDAFVDTYVIKEEVVPGDPSRRTVIRKPGIYNAVRSIEKQLNKEVKSEKRTQEEAAQEFTNVLKVALAAIDSESNTFEKALQGNKKDSSRLLAIFDNVELKNIY